MRCVLCGCDGPMTQHHVLPRQQIKREFPHGAAITMVGAIVRAPRRWPEEPGCFAGRIPLRDLLADKRNLMPLHFRCHLNHENWALRLWRDQIPPSAWEFAAELGEWATVALERAYPVRLRPDNSSRDPDPLGARDP